MLSFASLKIMIRENKEYCAHLDNLTKSYQNKIDDAQKLFDFIETMRYNNATTAADFKEKSSVKILENLDVAFNIQMKKAQRNINQLKESLGYTQERKDENTLPNPSSLIKLLDTIVKCPTPEHFNKLTKLIIYFPMFLETSETCIFSKYYGDILHHLSLVETRLEFNNGITSYKKENYRYIRHNLMQIKSKCQSFYDAICDHITEEDEDMEQELRDDYHERFYKAISILPHMSVGYDDEYISIFHTFVKIEVAIHPPRIQSCCVCLSDEVECSFIGKCKCKATPSGMPEHTFLCSDCRPNITKCVMCKTCLSDSDSSDSDDE